MKSQAALHGLSVWKRVGLDGVVELELPAFLTMQVFSVDSRGGVWWGSSMKKGSSCRGNTSSARAKEPDSQSELKGVRGVRVVG